MILPWHQSAWERLTESIDSLHHGLLIQSAPGCGLEDFCVALGGWLLCAAGGAERCGNCQNCRLFEAGTHPDIHLITTEQEAMHSRVARVHDYSGRYLNRAEVAKKARPTAVISIAQVRDMSAQLSLKAHISQHRVGLVMPADAMNIHAANALLKILEEPPPGVIFILGTTQHWRLPKTILSRCLKVVLNTPSPAQSLEWLQARIEPQQARRALFFAHGGPQQALDLHKQQDVAALDEYINGLAGVLGRRASPLALAAVAAKLDFEQALSWLQKFVVALAGGPCGNELADFFPAVNNLRERIEARILFDLYDRITHYRRIARANIDQQLAHEDLLLQLQSVIR